MTKNRWKNDEIEILNECPLCQCKKSTVLFNSLIDMMMKNSLDKWILNQCSECTVAYLSTRPNKKNIHKAYTSYYTHGDENSTIKKGKASALIDYLKKVIYNVKYKKEYSFKEYLTYLMIFIAYPVHLFLDSKIRHIGALNINKNRLLDIGCGNGEFLVFANRLGWDVLGLDVDNEAVNSALSKGVKVQLGGIESLKKDNMFDIITLNHVIEHVYNPAELIQYCYQHLNPGGKLWLETPNINSIGLNIYKEYWRGLEPPRHLMLYNMQTLSNLLSHVGFHTITQKTHGLSGVYMGIQSERNIAQFMGSRSFYKKLLKYPKVVFIEMVQLMFKRKSEFITLIAYK